MKRKIWGERLSQDRHTIAFYKHSENDQRDDLLFPFVKLLLRRASDKAEVFSLFPRAVCFTDSRNKWSWNGMRQPKPGVVLQGISQQTVESARCLSGRRYRAHSVSTTRCCQWFPRAPPHRMGVSLSRCDRGPFPDGSVCLQSLETRTTAKSVSHAFK